MSSNQGLNIDPPPRRPKRQDKSKSGKTAAKRGKPAAQSAHSGTRFSQVAEGEKVQFNKRVTRNTADGFEILAVQTRKKIPVLLAEGLELLEEKYGKV